MKNKETHKLTEILALIANHDGITLAEISERTGIGRELLMQNLTTFTENMENDHLRISFEEVEGEDSIWYMDTKRDDYCYLPFSPMEKMLFRQMLGEKETPFSSSSLIIMKELYNVVFDEKKIVQIIAAIGKKRILDITYVRPDQVVKEFTLKPVALYYYELENLFYVAGLYDEDVLFYRMDRIREIKETGSSFGESIGQGVEHLLDDVFGMDLGQPTRISIRFYNEGNVLRKVRREAAHLSSMLKEDEYGLRLEGTIRGVQKMKAWVRSFGSSAVVLEPEWLREEMIATAKTCLAFYD